MIFAHLPDTTVLAEGQVLLHTVLVIRDFSQFDAVDDHAESPQIPVLIGDPKYLGCRVWSGPWPDRS